MAVQAELSCLESFPPHLGPLDVLALKGPLESVFQNDTDPPTVLFTPHQPPPRDGTGILLRLHPTTAEELSGCGGRDCPTADSEPGLRVRLFASKLFLRHYRLQRHSDAGTVRPLEPVGLERVVLGARSRQSLRWAGGEQFAGGLMELCRSGREPLARQGDPLLLPHHPLFGEDKGQRWKAAPADLSQRSASFCRSASLPFASELHIQPVVSPQHSHPGCPDSLLAEHFSTPRVVSQGDILSVPAKKHPDLLEDAAEGLPRCPVLYFKVQKVLRSAADREEEGGGGGACLADKTHTSLYMGASTNSRVPYCCVEGESLWSSLSPPGLNKTVDLLTGLILPHLQHRDSLSACTVLLHGPAGSGKMTAVRAASRRLNLHLLKVDCVTACADTPAAAEARLSAVFQRAHALQPCVLLLRNLQLLLRARGAAEDEGRVQAVLCQLLGSAPTSVVVAATVCRARDLSAGVVAAFVHQVEMESPTEEQRLAMLVGLSGELPLGRDVNLERLSKLTAGFVLGDLSSLLAEAGRAACRRLVQTCGGRQQEDLCSSGVTIVNQDFSCALETLQDAQSKAIGAPKIPNVCWEDIGGLEHVKKEILDTVQLPLQRPELLSLGLNRTGILLYGPPGTGKTLLAKAVATECSMTFLSVKGPELINMYVGQSEENIREVFHRARSAAPCVVFFDELDSLAPNRGRSGDSGGVMDRVVSQLLAELDSLQSSAGVFVIGATNRPDLLDQSLLRPGRFDKLVYVGINEDRGSMLQVLEAILRKFRLEAAVNLQDVVDQCPAHMTGADLYALCSDAMTAAIKRKICLIKDGLDSEDSPILLSVEDFSSALKNFKPSVSEKELQRYRNIHRELSGK
ncbi:peroxisome assembly factor 2 isoform X3 [Fundulus heteroclitus]|uniref:peroxisome assembly factor 2 isoform X3 n=1 Tax=Fundulus heteroclitus TaxID=8078 RepID=UPI00165C435C|nr:peroxisome assembly factor 2 isoform X3 [Fundulus heteroclitus]